LKKYITFGGSENRQRIARRESASFTIVGREFLHSYQFGPGRRNEDGFYPLAVVSKFAERLRQRTSDVEFHRLPGKHRFPSKADRIVRAGMERVFQ
jgi:hypothetical protein